MPLNTMTRLERVFQEAVRKEAFNFSQWAARNNYKYIKGRWRKIGSSEPVTKDQMWNQYKPIKTK